LTSKRDIRYYFIMKENNDKGHNMDTIQTNSPELVPWLVYPTLYVGEVSAGNKSFRFLAEDKKGDKPVMLNSLPLEFFNQELLKVDTTSENSLIRFCEKWGLLLSPLYASKTHALSGRRAYKELAYGYYYPTSYRDGIAAVEERLAADVEAFKGSNGFDCTEFVVSMLIGSEFAHEAVARGDYGDSSRFGAVVSLDEVAFTVRLLQIGCAIQAAHLSGLRGRGLSLYLLNDKTIPRRHPIELETRHGMDLFFTSYMDAARQIEQIGSDDSEAKRRRMRAIDDLFLEMGVENARSFTCQAVLNLALENIWMREDGDKLEGEGFWGVPPQVTEGSLIEAILTNFDYVMAAPFDWTTCEHCGRVFKFQKEYDPTNRYRKSTFCRDSCRVRYAQIKRLHDENMQDGHIVVKINKGLTPDGDSQLD